MRVGGAAARAIYLLVGMSRVALGCSGAVRSGRRSSSARSLALEERRRLSPGVNDEAEHADARAAARTKALDSETRLSYSDQRYGSSRRSWALRCYLLSSC